MLGVRESKYNPKLGIGFLLGGLLGLLSIGGILGVFVGGLLGLLLTGGVRWIIRRRRS